MSKSHYSSKKYQQNRSVLLAGKPMCAYCGLREATTVDHIVELDRGGTHDMDNLVPACKPCNYGKGAAYGNAKRAARAKTRREAMREQPAWRTAVEQGHHAGTITSDGLWISECEWCGITFAPLPSGTVGDDATKGRYCSPECAHDGHRKTWTMTTVTATWQCRSCGKQCTHTYTGNSTSRRTRNSCGAKECTNHITGRTMAEKYHQGRETTPRSSWPALLEDTFTVSETVTTIEPTSGWRQGARAGTMTDDVPVSLRSTPAPAHHLEEISPKMHKNGQEPLRVPVEVRMKSVDGHEFPAPRFETRWAGDLSWGLEAVEAYERFRGVTLMPWQRYALCAQLAQVDGRLVHRTSLVTLPRQQGKTVAMGALILWWTTIYAERTGRPENVILVGHMLKTLEQVIMRDMGNRMVEQFDAKFFRSSGRMEIELPNGSRIWAIAANDSAGHGLSASLVVADELWDIDADVVDQAIMPTQSAQPMPLFSAWSTAGTEASTLMLRYRQLGLDAIDKGEQTRNLFLEWSAPPSADLHDPAVWAACNPAWGHTVNAEEVEAEARLEWQSFLRKRLNLWVSAQNSWLEPGTWEDLVTTEEPSGPLKVLAVDSSPDGSRIVGVGVWPLADDRVLVAPCFTVTSEREAWREIRRLLEPSTMLAITPGLNGHTPPELQSRTTQVGYGELAQWTSPVINRIIHGTVAHHGEQLLTDHVSRAVAVTTKDGLVLSTQKSPGPIELARCAVWAIYLATKPARQARPAIGKATTRPRNWVL